MADIGNKIPPYLFQIALQCHVEDKHHDHPVLQPPQANLEFHRHIAIRDEADHALCLFAAKELIYVFMQQHIIQRLANKPLAKKPDGGVVSRLDLATGAGDDQTVIQHAANLVKQAGTCLHNAVGWGGHNRPRCIFRDSLYPENRGIRLSRQGGHS